MFARSLSWREFNLSVTLYSLDFTVSKAHLSCLPLHSDNGGWQRVDALLHDPGGHSWTGGSLTRGCGSISNSWGRDVGFGSKMGQIGPKWDKYRIFSDQISVHYGSVSQNILKSNLKKLLICPIRC